MIKIYSVDWCPSCVKVKSYLDKRGFEYEVINVADAHEDRNIVEKVSGQRTVPVTEINGHVIVGYNKLEIDKALEV
ncbi:Glutaredoxin-like protein, YruB-family [Clostridium cavendishii DSM 21758]|uniref:Glutaredoxin-like protein, YruB-family n=1 Tax=Clostridium cavendishii DSM 21758 TaxID=1121302 RepID=A0A1M6V1P8_9CLOT|nr:glutaredoxin domain-containing protein [Clostridium cavendishii]SHK75419.1 Glutaredoxin-like protein, YruB-family [Clostridium cavendishii DSM 21758]